MLQTLDILDGRSRTASPCAKLTYNDETKEFNIRIEAGMTPNDVPMMMEPFVERGQLDMGPAWARRWVEERIPPAGRQNLGEILRAHELEEYDEFALLVSTRGVSSQDYFVVRLPLEHAKNKGLRGSTENNPFRKHVGKELAKARKNAGLKQHELAAKSGIDQAVISRIETGKANATIDLLASLAQALDCSIGFSLTKRE